MPSLQQFRAVFGDERQDYDGALQQHYANGPPSDWPERFVTAYASSHPWEDSTLAAIVAGLKAGCRGAPNSCSPAVQDYHRANGQAPTWRLNWRWQRVDFILIS